MNGNLNPSQNVGVIGAIAPISQAAGTVTSAWIDMRDWFEVLAAIALGVLGAGATVDGKIEQATDNTGAGVKDVAGSAIGQLTKAGADDGKQVLINVRQDDLDRNAGYRFVRLSLTVGTAASLVSGLLVGFNPRYGAPTDNDATTVKQIVS